jgi:hypothetical protein
MAALTQQPGMVVRTPQQLMRSVTTAKTAFEEDPTAMLVSALSVAVLGSLIGSWREREFHQPPLHRESLTEQSYELLGMDIWSD